MKKTIDMLFDLWIGINVSIIGGVSIGSNSIIAAGSIVIRDIPGGVIAGGNPAKGYSSNN